MSVQDDKLATFTHYFPRLVSYTTTIVGSQAIAEDVVQEAWLRFDQQLTHQTVEQPERYLYRIVRNLALDVQRRQQIEQRYISASLQDENDTTSVEDVVYSNEALHVIANALQELPERTRVVFESYRSGDKTMQQIADEQAISVGLVHKLLRDAMTYCAKALGNNHD